MSFLLRTKRSEYPTERTLAVRRLPENRNKNLLVEVETTLMGTTLLEIMLLETGLLKITSVAILY